MNGVEIGQLLRETRFKAGLTQGSLAQKLHCDRTYISKVELGEKVAKIDFVLNWARVTGCYQFFLAHLSNNEEWNAAMAALDKVNRITEIISGDTA